MRRYNYVTPTSYLELLTTFIKLLGGKRTEINETKRRLEVGGPRQALVHGLGRASAPQPQCPAAPVPHSAARSSATPPPCTVGTEASAAPTNPKP
jgi:hypothetical protein